MMNWIDGILVVLLLASVVVGSKKGLIRELMAFAVFFAAIIISINYIDNFAAWVYGQLGGSPLISAFLSFIILLALTYAAFKILGLIFYRIASLKKSGKKDQMGGALIGFLRGWVAVGFVTFLAFLLPMPDRFYIEFESSFFGPAVAKTIPLMFEGTSSVHPRNPDFMEQIERTLLFHTSGGGSDLDEQRTQVHRVLFHMEQFFDTDFGSS